MGRIDAMVMFWFGLFAYLIVKVLVDGGVLGG